MLCPAAAGGGAIARPGSLSEVGLRARPGSAVGAEGGRRGLAGPARGLVERTLVSAVGRAGSAGPGVAWLAARGRDWRVRANAAGWAPWRGGSGGPGAARAAERGWV